MVLTLSITCIVLANLANIFLNDKSLIGVHKNVY